MTGVELSLDGDDLVCRAAPGVLTTELREAIAARKPDLIALLRGTGPQSGGGGGIPRLSQKGRYRLSPAQERMWFAHSWGADDGLYNLAVAASWRKVLSPAEVGASLRRLAAGQSALRTWFEAVEGVPHANVADQLGEIPVPVVDLRHLPEKDRAAEVRRRAAGIARQPIDLTRLPLLRCAILSTSDSGCSVVFVLPHILTDAASMRLLVEGMDAELRFGDAAIAAGGGAAASAAATLGAAVELRDAVAWQRAQVGSERAARSLDYWRHQLAGVDRTHERDPPHGQGDQRNHGDDQHDPPLPGQG
jgi:hypothetical protein